MYKVTLKHFKPSYRKGDLESDTEIISVDVFKLKKDARAFIESKLNGKSSVIRNYQTGDKVSYCCYFTGKTWIHENTGDKLEESFTYELIKIKKQ